MPARRMPGGTGAEGVGAGKFIVAILVAATLPLLIVGPLGTLRAQVATQWSWTSGALWLGHAPEAHVGAEVHNASPGPQRIAVELRRAHAPYDVIFDSETTVQPGASTGAAIDCGAPLDPACGPGVVLAVRASSPQVAPSGWVDPSGGAEPEAIERLPAGDFLRVAPRRGDAAAAVATDRNVRALQRRVNRNQRRVINLLDRIQRAVR